jgi:NodT family efflux transporter outer membrane factor (OMF) lipoprotein
MSRRIPLLGAAVLLSACTTVGPEPRPPMIPLTAAAPFAGAAGEPFSRAPARDDWWRLYRDPALDRLVAEALARNTDLAVAAANLAQARALLLETRSQRYPSTATGGSARYGRGSAAAIGQDEPLDDGSAFDVGLDAAYELDLVGRIRRSLQAATADVEAADAARDAVRVTVAAETARAYAEACASARQLAVGRRTLELQQQSSSLAARTFRAGRGTRLDVARVEALQAQTRASLPGFEAQRRGALFRLSVFTGRPPAETSAEASNCSAMPDLIAPIPVGEGAGMLARRPDVRQAERRLAAATARIGVATATLYPSVTLGGSLGLTSQNLGDLASTSAFRWSLGPLISWSYPNRRLARARIVQAEAAAAGALAGFDGTVLAALLEAETALVRYAGELDRRTALLEARDLNAEAVRLAQIRNRAGADGFLPVLDAERSLAASEATLAASEALLVDLQIGVFKALAGAWTGDMAVASLSAADEPGGATPQ